MMGLFRWELKKIWSPGILAVLLLLGVVYYWMFPYFYIEHFNNGPYEEADFQLASEWVEKYGPTMEPEERAELDGQLAEEILEFNQQIATIPEAVTAELTDYNTFLLFREKSFSDAADAGGQADMDVEALIQRVYGGTNWYIIHELNAYLEHYDSQAEIRGIILKQTTGEWGDHSDAMIQREKDLADPSQGNSLLPGGVQHATVEYGKGLAVWCVLSVVLLLSPTLVRDRLRGIRPMQWSSWCGRSILNTQMAAALLSGGILTAVNLIVYAIPFLAQDSLQFRDCSLGKIWGGSSYSWFDWSYGAYILILTALIIALSLAAAGLTVFLSQYSGNYISMLMKSLPLFVVLGAVLGSWLLDNPFYFRRLWSETTGPWLPKGTEVVVAIVLLLISAGLCISACQHQTRRELM